MTDQQLLEDYRLNGADDAFATLVNRHLNLVYSAALRQVHEPAMAQDVTQAVFIVLSQKGKSLEKHPAIAGWLVRTTHFASLKAIRAESRRRRTEQKALEMNSDSGNEEATWEQIAPLLDQAITKLGGADRNALVLRFFEGRTFAEVAAAIGTSEDAAKKRVTRVLERLRARFAARKLPLAVASLAALLGSETVKAAPTQLAASLPAQSAAAASPSTWIIAKETMRALFWTKMQLAASVATLCVLIAGTAGMAVFTAEEFIFSTPKNALRSLAKAFSQGDGRKFVDGLYLTINESPVEGEAWKPTVEKLVSAEGRLRKAALERFGASAVNDAMPIWHHLDEMVSKLTEGDEHVTGTQAKFPISIFVAQTPPEVPLMLKTNGLWKLAVDLSFKAGKPEPVGRRNNLRMWFQGQGLHLALTSAGGFDAATARLRFESWAIVFNETAMQIRSGKFASATEAWDACSSKLEGIEN